MLEKMKSKISGHTFLLAITIVLFFVMYIAGMIVFADKNFTRLQVFLNLFISNAGLIITAVGMTMVLITGGIDISVGSVVAMTCMELAFFMEKMQMPSILAIVLVLVVGMVFGLVQGWLVSYLKIQPFIVTLAGMFFARGMTAVISEGMISITNESFLWLAKYQIPLPFGGYENRKGEFIAPYISWSVVLAIVVLVVFFVILKYTKFGRSVYAVGGNEQSALLMGLNVRTTKLKVYLLNGLLTALGGFAFCLNSCSGFVEQAKGFEMDAIASAVIGGTLLTGGVGNVFGTLFGVLIKGTIETLISFQGTLSSWWVRIAIAAMLCFFIILQSVFAKLKAKK